MSYHKQELLRRIDDPQKRAYVEALQDENVLRALTSFSYSEADYDLIHNHPDEPMLTSLRILYYQRLMDWGSERADAIQEEITEFIGSETFVQYPDFLVDEAIVAAIKDEHINNHSRTLRDLQGSYGPNVEILGARVNDEGRAEVLVLHNQMKAGSVHDGPMAFDRDRLDLPPEVITGLLKKNPPATMYGRPNEVYISMQSPYPGYRSGWTEVVIGQMGEDGIIMPAENV